MKSYLKRCAGALAVAAALAGIAAGCSPKAADESGSAGGISIVDFADRSLVFEEPPQRIVALGNGEVELIYALGGTLVGRPAADAFMPVEAAREAAVIGGAHSVDLEKIASVRPDVVLGNDPLHVKDIPMLGNIGAQVVLTRADSIGDIRRQIELFGRLLGREDKAAELIAGIDAELALAAAEPKPEAQPRVLMVYGAPGTYLAALPNSLAGNLLETAGGRNMAAEFPRLQNFPQYAQLNAERVVEANPDVILLMTHGSSEDVEQGFKREMADNPAWNSISAVRDRRVHVLPAELFGTNPGTKVVEAVRALRALLDT